MKPKTSSRLLTAASALTVLVAAGCAEERAPINRVQADALDKSFFVGKLADLADNPVFYSKGFVIDQSAGQSGISVGLYTGTDRIKWEITEDYLIAHKAYQIAKGQDTHGLPDGVANGTVVAKYRITSHFDIKRAYNPSTGEQINVIEENGSDRPWYQREHMRVDWSTNDVDDPMWGEVFIGKIFGDTTVLPLTYTITDPASEDAPHFETSDGYFDVTNKYYVAPENTYFAQWGVTLPTCALIGLFTSTSTKDCNAQEATVRHSFWKVKADHDFEPTENTYRKMDVIANFGGAGDSFQPGFAGGTTQCWDPQYAYTQECFHQYLAKHNFWAKSHTDIACSNDADGNNDGTADACSGYAGAKGSQCDLSHGLCTIPLRDRSIKAVGYWLNKETPDELLDDATSGARDANGQPAVRGSMETVVHTWDQAMRVALAYGREVECRRTSDGDRNTCHGQFFDAGDQMLAFGGWTIPIAKKLPQDAPWALTSCHAPVRDYDDHTTCGPTGEVARNGDQRKNFIYYWPYDSDAMYGGVAGLGQDPETGESHGASATVMGRSATRAAANYRDYIQYAMGDISLDDFSTGVPQQIYTKLMDNGYSPASDSARAARGEKVEYSANPAGAPAKAPAQHDKLSLQDDMAMRKLVARVQDQSQMTYASALQDSSQPLWESYAAKLRGTPYEAQLVDSGWAMHMTGSNPSLPVTGSTLDAASPLRNLDSGRLNEWRTTMANRLANKGVCFTEDVPRIGSLNFQGLMTWYQRKFEQMGIANDPTKVKDRGDYIYQDLYKQMAMGIAIHEVGHCLGMRHNFASSWDAPNFMPQYWQLRSDDGNAAALCTGPRNPNDPNDSCMGPRWMDPETDRERGLTDEGHPGVGYFGNTSVMEYEADYLSPGFGTYDLAYVKAVYGGVLETHDLDASPAEGGFNAAEQSRFTANLPLQLSELSMLDDQAAHYTDIADALHTSVPRCRDATPEELELGQWRVIHGKVCSGGTRDHWVWKDFKNDAEAGDVPSLYAGFLNFSYWQTAPIASENGRQRQRWNYRYGETYGTGYMHTNPSDTGADVYEVTVNTSRFFDVTYPQTYFRRHNKEYFYEMIPGQIADRYFERMRGYHWVLEGSDDYLSQFPKVYQGYTRARAESFYMLTRAATTPEAGGMTLGGDPTGQRYFDSSDGGQFGSEFVMAPIDGRYVSDDFSNIEGGAWDYLAWLNHAGFAEERGLAIRSLVDGRPTLYTISRETALDGRNVMKNFRTDQQRGLDRFLGGILGEDWDTVGPWVDPSTYFAGEDNQIYASPQYLNILDQNPTRPAGASAVQPNIGYKTQLAAVIFTHLFSRMSTDMTLVNKMRVYVDGLDHISALPGTEQARFTDPVSGLTYVAHRFGGETLMGKQVDTGIASRMMVRANALLAAAYDVQRTGNDPVLDAYGQPTLIQPGTVRDPNAEAMLRRYIGLLDATRQIGRYLDGPLGNPD